jgi:glucose/arabinose dehydrogenase
VDAFVPPKSGGLRNPVGVVFGPDHNLYVSSFTQGGTVGPGHDTILRYDGSTGAFLGNFADDKSLTNPRSILFGPDGNLYVANKFGAGAVLRFDGTTGAFLDTFVLTGTAGLDDPTTMVFGPDGKNDGKLDLYVGQGTDNSNVLRFDGATGAFKGVFVPSFAGGLHHVGGMVFGPDGNLYVVSQNTGTVLRYEGPGGTNPGAFLGTVVSGLSSPVGLLFGPDDHGAGKLDLYVTNSVSDGKTFAGEVLRYDWKTGAFLDTFVPPASGGLGLAFLMTFSETDPTTLNYGGITTPDTASTLLAQPAGSARAVPTSVQLGTGTLSAVTGATDGTASRLTAAQVNALVPEAFARCQAAGVDTSSLAGLDIRIADLGGTTLGLTAGHTIWLDDNAAGWGWFVDRSPGDDSEFSTAGDQGEQNHMELLTALEQEVGQLLGYDHADGDLMDATLAAGTRKPI